MTDLAQKLADAAVQAIATQCPVSTGDRAREVAAHAIRQSLATHGGEAVALHGIKNGVMLEPDDLRFLMEQAGIGEGFDEGDAAAVVLWVGDTIDMDDGVESRQYGLNVYNTEVPEEGSCCLRELPRPAAHPAPTSQASEREERLLNAHHRIIQMMDGSQPKDYAGALMVAQYAVKEELK